MEGFLFPILASTSSEVWSSNAEPSSRGYALNDTNTKSGSSSNSTLDLVKHIGYIIFSVGMVFAPHIGYVFQFRKMYLTSSFYGYSPLVSIILLSSNYIRILYYFGHKFALALLFQSIFAILVHGLVLIEVLYIKNYIAVTPFEDSESVPPIPTSTDPTSDPESPFPASNASCSFFGMLDRVAHYLEEGFLVLSIMGFVHRSFMFAGVVLAFVGLLYVFKASSGVDTADVVGYTSLTIEALLVLPQILYNHRRKSTEGLTTVLVLTWVLGDIIKVIYFFFDHQPLPFIVCGIFQLFLDGVVVAQAIYYRLRKRPSGDLMPLPTPIAGSEQLDNVGIREKV